MASVLGQGYVGTGCMHAGGPPEQCLASASASPDLAVGLIPQGLQREMLMSPVQILYPLLSSASERSFREDPRITMDPSLAWKPLLTPRSTTLSMIWRSSVDLRREFGPLYGMRQILKTYAKYVNSQTIAL